MDCSRFDALASALCVPGSRRRVLGLLASFPMLGGLPGILTPEEGEAKERRRRRKLRHKRRKNAGSRKKGCRPRSKALVCAGRCGEVKNRNTCGKRVDCGPCDCNPPCQSPTPTCVNGICTGCSSHAECGGDALCVDGVCHACDVNCNAGTPADCGAELQTAFGGSKATLYICPGSYGGGFSLTRALTVIGAGAAQTILDGNDERQVMLITADVPVTLRALTVTGGKEVNGDDPGAGIYSTGELTLIDAVVSNNHATSANSAGGGIFSTNSLTLRNTVVRGNSGRYGGGVHISGGSLALESGSSIEENEAKGEDPGWGGGIYVNDGVVTLQSGSRVADNTATGSGGAILYFLSRAGASITVEPGAVICENSDPQCDGSGDFEGNCPTAGTCPA